MVHARGQKSTKLLMITGNTCNTAFVIAPQIARIILNDINVVSRDSRSCRIPAYSYPSFFSRNGFVRPWSMKDETRKCSRWIIPSQIDRNGNCCFTRLVETTCVTAIIERDADELQIRWKLVEVGWKFSFHRYIHNIPFFESSILAKKEIYKASNQRRSSEDAGAKLIPFAPAFFSVAAGPLPSFDIPFFLFRTMSHAFAAYNRAHCLVPPPPSHSHLDSATLSLSLSSQNETRVYSRLVLYLCIRASQSTGFGSEDTPLGMRGDKKDKRGVFVSRRCRLV